jgi:hypothetical protein
MLNRRVWVSLLLALAALPATASAQTKPLELKWSEVGSLVTGHQVVLTLTDANSVQGEVVALRDDSLLLDVSKAVKGYPKGNGAVPRGSIVLIDLQRTKGSWGRILGTVIGTLGGMSLGGYVDAKSSPSAGQGIGTFVGLSGAGAVAGYYTGRAIDRRVTHIRIVP